MSRRRYPVPMPSVAANPVSASTTFDGSQWMTTKEAAEYLRTTVGGIRNMVYRGQLIPHKPFGRLLFKRTDLARAVESSRKGGVNGY
ncbi:MAG: Helix-turn-helix domain [Pseudomonadota bacterium]